VPFACCRQTNSSSSNGAECPPAKRQQTLRLHPRGVASNCTHEPSAAKHAETAVLLPASSRFQLSHSKGGLVVCGCVGWGDVSGQEPAHPGRFEQSGLMPLTVQYVVQPPDTQAAASVFAPVACFQKTSHSAMHCFNSCTCDMLLSLCDWHAIVSSTIFSSPLYSSLATVVSGSTPVMYRPSFSSGCVFRLHGLRL
jgi:hypothetical protein